MAKKKLSEKMCVPKFKIPDGSHAITPFGFELHDLYKIIEECKERKLNSIAMALERIYENITKKRDSYRWIEPK